MKIYDAVKTRDKEMRLMPQKLLDQIKRLADNQKLLGE
jgi:hypothetical protein